MAVATPKSHKLRPQDAKPAKNAATRAVLPAIRGLLLARIACAGGATRAQIVRDLGALVAHKFSPAEWREAVGTETGELVAARLCSETRGRLTPSESGFAQSELFLGSKNPKSETSWPEMRDGRLVAKALDIARIGPTILNALARPDGLRAIILQKAFGLKVVGERSVSHMRGALALVALERAFGNKIKTGLGSGSGFSPRAGRLLAGQLSLKPRDFDTDARLVTCLAAEAANARQSDIAALRMAILKGFVTRGVAESTAAVPCASTPVQAANDKGLPGGGHIPGAGPFAVRRPGLEEFAALVVDGAASCSQGWAGNRKALICKVWEVIAARHPGWALSSIEFKCMLVEAHRSGLLMLAGADLKTKDAVKDLDASEITYKNMVWHLIRVT